jgi:ubiquinone biosynthesis monooxygenase Coq7
MNLISKVPRLVKSNNLLKLATSARFQSTLDTNKAETNTTEGEAYRDLTPSELESIRTMLRINQAGEIGANYIYMGQYQVFKNDKNLKDLIHVSLA